MKNKFKKGDIVTHVDDDKFMGVVRGMKLKKANADYFLYSIYWKEYNITLNLPETGLTLLKGVDPLNLL